MKMMKWVGIMLASGVMMYAAATDKMADPEALLLIIFILLGSIICALKDIEEKL